MNMVGFLNRIIWKETLTMEGDPSIPVIVDTWMKGLRDFDVDLAYEANVQVC